MNFARVVIVTMALVFSATFSVPAAFSQDVKAPATAPTAGPSLDWWHDAKFGLFLHWGLYSVTAGEWNGHRAKGNEHFMIYERIPLKEYARLATEFNPVKFDADQWVLTAKNAGMKYIVITAKHHEGFAMFNSPSSAYNIVKATPWGKDPMAALADACKKHGMVLGFYYSLGRDWEDPDVPTNWPTKGGRSNTVDYPDEDKKVFSRYFERKVKPQVRELLTQYGPVGVLWFDTPEMIPADESRELRKLVHDLQPDCIVNNRIGNGMGDYSVSEQSLDTQASSKPWEACTTIGSTWAYSKYDSEWKTPEVILRNMIEVVSKGGNFLLDFGPTGEGEFPAPAVERLAAIGRWMNINGEAIYGTHPWRITGENPPRIFPPATKPSSDATSTMKDTINDVTPQSTPADLRFTAKGNIVYVIARSWHDPKVVVKSMAKGMLSIAGVDMLGEKSPLHWEQSDAGLTIDLPADDADEIPIVAFRVR